MTAKRMKPIISLEVKGSEVAYPYAVHATYNGQGSEVSMTAITAYSAKRHIDAIKALNEALAEAYANFVQAVST